MLGLCYFPIVNLAFVSFFSNDYFLSKSSREMLAKSEIHSALHSGNNLVQYYNICSSRQTVILLR